MLQNWKDQDCNASGKDRSNITLDQLRPAIRACGKDCFDLCSYIFFCIFPLSAFYCVGGFKALEAEGGIRPSALISRAKAVTF